MKPTYINLAVSKYMDKEYIPYMEDMIRMIIIQFSIHIMMYSNRDDYTFFSFEFFEIIIYMLIGVSIYWLLFKKVIKIE